MGRNRKPPHASVQLNDLVYDEKYIYSQTCTNVYKGHSRELENVAFMNSCPLYAG